MPRREFPDSPIVGVGAVVLDGKRVLLVRREVEEETGLEVSVGAMIEVLDRIVFAPATVAPDSFNGSRGAGRVRYHYVLIDFLCIPAGGHLRPGSDAIEVRWIMHEELNSHGLYRLAPATVRVIEKAFTMVKAVTPSGDAGNAARQA